MSTTRVSCSIDDSVLKMVDEKAQTLGKSRSATISDLLEVGLMSKEPAQSGVFVELGPFMRSKLDAWAERMGEADLSRIIFNGFIDGVGADDFMQTATSPCTVKWLTEMMGGPDAPTEGLASLWLDPATENTMHPSLIYEPSPGSRYRPGLLAQYLGMSGRIVSSNVEDPDALGYKEVYRERS